jgi:hypothetical protein
MGTANILQNLVKVLLEILLKYSKIKNSTKEKRKISQKTSRS